MVKFVEFVDGDSNQVVSRKAWEEMPPEQRAVGEVPIARVVRWSSGDRAVIEEYDDQGVLLRTHTLRRSG